MKIFSANLLAMYSQNQYWLLCTESSSAKMFAKYHSKKNIQQVHLNYSDKYIDNKNSILKI